MSTVKYQHYLARHHMSWFANSDGTSSFWSVLDGRLLDDVKLTEIGGQNHLYESDELPRNFVEKQILNKVETDFFAARNRAISDKAVRRSADRQAVRRYVAAQFLRQGYLHKRLIQLEQDLLFIAKEMGVTRFWGAENVLPEGRRRRASSSLAKGLLELEETASFLKKHVVIFVERAENDLLLPDRGLVQIYDANGKLRTDGLGSPSLEVLMPIAPNAALKLVRPGPKRKFPHRVRMSNEAYAEFMQNLGLNANSFITGTKDAIATAQLDDLLCFDPNIERWSKVKQIYKAGVLDDLVDAFWSSQVPYLSKADIRNWFYKSKFVPAINKLFNPSRDPNAETIFLRLDERQH